MNEPTQDQSPKPRLSPETVAKLRGALKRWVAGDGADDSVLRDALRVIATEARDGGIQAEEVLVTLKTAWLELGGTSPGVHAGSATSHKRLEDLVTACIKAYYG